MIDTQEIAVILRVPLEGESTRGGFIHTVPTDMFFLFRIISRIH